jgi:putative aldouronate transport system substrate-binding protein
VNRLKKRLFTVLSCVLVSTLLLSACSSGTTTSSSPSPEASKAPVSEAPKASETPKASDAPKVGENAKLVKPVDFSFYSHYDNITLPTWGGDVATKWIKENLKVNVEVINASGASEAKLNTMIASKKLPDAIWIDKGTDAMKLIENNMLVPLNEYIDKYPNFKKWAGESLELLRQPDGNIYQLPNWYSNQAYGTSGYAVNAQIYEELGKPPLDTTDDFYNYLKMVKQKFPDVIPFDPGTEMQGGHIMYGAFKENTSSRPIQIRGVPDYEKNELTSLFQDQQYRELIQFLNKLYNEKLMTQDAFTQTADMVKEKVVSGKVAVYAASSTTEYASLAHESLKKKDPNHKGFIMIMPFAKPGLDKSKIFTGDWSGLGWNTVVITKNAKDPEAIFSYLDWATGPEGQTVLQWGPEGHWWNGFDENGDPKLNDKYFTEKDVVQKFIVDTQNYFWNGNVVFLDSTKQRHNAKLPEDQQRWETLWQMKVTWKTQFNGNEFVNLFPAGDTPAGRANDRVDKIKEEAEAKAIQAKNPDDVLKILDKAEADAQKAGYKEILAFQNEKWKDNRAKQANAKK